MYEPIEDIDEAVDAFDAGEISEDELIEVLEND